MKEQEFVQNHNISELTLDRVQSKLKTEEVVFMVDSGNQEQAKTLTPSTEDKVKKPQEALEISQKEDFSAITRPLETIESPVLKNYVTELRERIQQKPLKDWTVEELKQEYFNFSKLTLGLEKKASFAERGKIAGDAQQYSLLLTDELERRGEEASDIAQELSKTLRKAGIETPLGGGAAVRVHEHDIRSTTAGSPDEWDEIQNFIFGASPREPGHAPEDIPGGSVLETRINARMPEIENLMRHLAETLPSGDSIPDSVLAWMAHFHNGIPVPGAPGMTTERYRYAEEFLMRVLFKPFKTPTVDYELRGFYTETNINTLLEIIERKEEERIQTMPPGAIGDRVNRGTQLRILKEAIKYYHAMNKAVNSGLVDQYKQISPVFPIDFFDVVKELPGVAQAKRLYETAYRVLIDRDGAVDNTNFPEVRRMVQTWIQEENRADIFMDGLDANGRLLDWEVNRAIDLAESMLTIEFRTTEKLNMGKISRINAYASFPQEMARRLLDWFNALGFRFNIDQVQGGVNVMQRVAERYRTTLERRYPWLDPKNSMRLKQIGHAKVDDLELAGIFNVSGIWSGYRLEVGGLDRIVVEIGGKEISIYEFLNKTKLTDVISVPRAQHILNTLLSGNILDEKAREKFRISLTATETAGSSVRGRIKDISDIKVNDILSAAKRVRSSDGMNQINAILEEIFTPLISQTSIGLGAILSTGSLNHPNLYHVREMIWKKVIEYDPLIIASNLSRLEFKDGIAGAPDTLDKILKDNNFLNGEQDPGWIALRSKLIIAHEKRMQNAIGALRSVTPRPQGGIRDEGVPLDLSGLTPEELRVVNVIRTEGLKITKDLSFIRFPYAVFLDDLPFKEASYREMGPEFFRRRAGSDTPHFAEAHTAWVNLVGKPAELNPMEDGIKAFEAIVDNAGNVLGVDVTQDRVIDSLFEGYCEFIEQYDWAQQFIISGIAHELNKPTSEAQKYGGRNAPAYNKYVLVSLFDKALQHGILRREGQGKIQLADGTVFLETWDDTYNDFRKRKKVTFINILLAILRDFLIGAIITGTWNFGKEVAKEEKH